MHKNTIQGSILITSLHMGEQRGVTMKFELKFSKGNVGLELPEKNLLGVLEPNKVAIELSGAEEIKRALANPIKSQPLRKIVQPGEKVVIVTSDITRPMPSTVVLPPVLDELQAAGVKDEDIKVVFALGIHRGHTEVEKKALVGEEIFHRIACVDSDPSDTIHLGTTKNGTPIEIFNPVAQADRRILLGNIEYHYFAGYSGGAKAIMPGVSTRAAIQANHKRMVEDSAQAGNLYTNNVRNDIDEVAQFVPIDFIVNVVLDAKKQVIKAVAGNYLAAHREGCRFLDSLYKLQIPQRAEIVIVSAGGFPKDINLYQAQKALDNAKHAIKKDGIIILVASCKEGFGEDVFERWMLGVNKSQQLIENIRTSFELGGHKAAAIAMVLQSSKIFLVSDLEPDFVHKLFMEPFPDVQSALHQALIEKGQDAGIFLMPLGGSTLPFAGH